MHKKLSITNKKIASIVGEEMFSNEIKVELTN